MKAEDVREIWDVYLFRCSLIKIILQKEAPAVHPGAFSPLGARPARV